MNCRRLVIAGTWLLACFSGAALTAQDSVLSRTVQIVAENAEAIRKVTSELAPEFARLDAALDEVATAHADTSVPEAERLGRAADAKAKVITAIEAIEARAPELRAKFRAQIDALRAARGAVGAGSGTARDTEEQKANRERKKEIAAYFASLEDLPPEWRELFAMAFDMLVEDGEGTEELGAQAAAAVEEAVAALEQMRKEFYLAYAENAKVWNSLRKLRTSEALQQKLLLSAKDLNGLLEASGATRELVKRLSASGPSSASGSMQVLRGVLDRIKQQRGQASQKPKDPQQQRRDMDEYRRRHAERIAKEGR
ncbi:MAG: hypothetical protein AB7I19_13920 [Planctomycetota bacterium]